MRRIILVPMPMDPFLVMPLPIRPALLPPEPLSSDHNPLCFQALQYCYPW